MEKELSKSFEDKKLKKRCFYWEKEITSRWGTARKETRCLPQGKKRAEKRTVGEKSLRKYFEVIRTRTPSRKRGGDADGRRESETTSIEPGVKGKVSADREGWRGMIAEPGGDFPWFREGR